MLSCMKQKQYKNTADPGCMNVAQGCQVVPLWSLVPLLIELLLVTLQYCTFA